MAASNPLSLAVRDFGPIVSADIALRPLTVFVGPSNTGKSYLAALIYALHRHFAAGMAGGGFVRQRDARLMSEAAHIDARRLVAAVVDHGQRTPVEISEEVRAWVRSVVAANDPRLSLAIRRCFGVEGLGALIRKGGAGSARLSLRRAGLGATRQLEHTLDLQSNAARLTMAIPRVAPVPEGIGHERWNGELGGSLPGFFDALLTPFLAGPLGVPAYYLPADRSGVMRAHSVVVNAVTEAAVQRSLRSDVGPPLMSGVLADFLQQLMTMGQKRGSRSANEDPARRVEERVLRGSVQIGRAAVGDAPHFLYRPRRWREDLPLLRSSSMVSDLAPLVLYLRHVVRPGEVLIIEEPEAHLHPEAQAALAREIVRLVAEGFRFIVTTHSDWMLLQFANQVRLFGLDPDRRERLDEAPELRPQDVAVWLFRPTEDPHGSAVEEISFDPDSGGFDTGYGDVADALYRDWAEIGNRIVEEG